MISLSPPLTKKKRGPGTGDLGVAVCISEENDDWQNPESSFRRFCRLFNENQARLAIITVNASQQPALVDSLHADLFVNLQLPPFPDPLGMRREIAVKILLNAHSTGVMAILGRVTGNTMSSVVPGNLKLIGRATFLILLHVNEIISSGDWIAVHGKREPVNFEMVNAVLFDAMDYVALKSNGQTAEVALSIIRILEALKTRSYISWDQAKTILDTAGPEGYLHALFPGAASGLKKNTGKAHPSSQNSVIS